MSSLSFKKVNDSVIKKIIDDNLKYKKPSPNETIKYFFKLPSNLTINIYSNNTVFFQGNNASESAKKYNLTNLSSTKVNTKKIELPNIGCDEVGVGDFFGPLITCCVLIDENFAKQNEKLSKTINDSKLIKDTNILDIFQELKNKVKWGVYVLDNEKYNKAYSIYKNTHILKAICHNQALKRLFRNNKGIEDVPIIMDQFVNETKYYSYLTEQKDVVKNIHFETKAESKYLSVACASIIARAHFLMEIKKLEEEFDVKLKLGASNDVKALVNEYKVTKKEDIAKFTKLHFNSQITKK